MGTKISPSHANIIIVELERNLLLSAPYKPLSWLRFIEDIDMKGVEHRDCLNHFITFANSFRIQSNSQLTYLKKTFFGHTFQFWKMVK